MIQAFLCLLFLPFLYDAFRRADLGRFDPVDLATWFALTVFIFAALLLTRNMPEGVSLQYSGAAFLALTLGYARALWSMSLLLIITQPWSLMGQILFIDALLPIWTMVSLVGYSRRFLPANPFVFLLGCSFIGLFLVYAIQVFASALAHGFNVGEPVLSSVFSEPTAWSLLLASGEATLEGMIITILVVYYPRAVVLFDDKFYLSKRL